MKTRLCSQGLGAAFIAAVVAVLVVGLFSQAVGQCSGGACQGGIYPTDQRPSFGSRLGQGSPFAGLRQAPQTRLRRLDPNDIRYRAVVRIRAENDTKHQFGSGVAIRWGAKAVVVTAAHVVKGCKKVFVRIRGRWIECRAVRFDRTWDVAFCDLSRDDVPTLSVVNIAFGMDATPEVGTPLESCGFGPDDVLAANDGKLLQYVAEKPGFGSRASKDWMDISGPAREGDSGGPVFNRQGELVGVLWGTDQRTTVATQAGLIHKLLAETYGVWDGSIQDDRLAHVEQKQMESLPLRSNPRSTPAPESDRSAILPWRSDIQRLEKQNADAAAANAAAMARIAEQLANRPTPQPCAPTLVPVPEVEPEPSGPPTWAIVLCVVAALLVGGFIFYVVQQN